MTSGDAVIQPDKPQSAPAASCDWRLDSPEPLDDGLDHACLENQTQVVESCDWRLDSPEPLDDDLERTCLENQTRAAESCDWRPDSPELEIDEIGTHRVSVQEPQVAPNKTDDKKQPREEAGNVSPGASPRVGHAPCEFP